jgi:sporulation protein YtfJ
MTEERITDLLETSMGKLKEMLKVGMIVGDPINVGGNVIIPIAKIKCGFVSGGMDQLTQSKDKTDLPFAGATAGTLNIIPIAFLASKGEQVEVLHLASDTHILEKTIDGVGEIIQSLIKKEEK